MWGFTGFKHTKASNTQGFWSHNPHSLNTGFLFMLTPGEFIYLEFSPLKSGVPSMRNTCHHFLPEWSSVCFHYPVSLQFFITLLLL